MGEGWEKRWIPAWERVSYMTTPPERRPPARTCGDTQSMARTSEDHFDVSLVLQVSRLLSMRTMPTPVPRATRCVSISEEVGDDAEHHIVVKCGGRRLNEWWRSRG